MATHPAQNAISGQYAMSNSAGSANVAIGQNAAMQNAAWNSVQPAVTLSSGIGSSANWNGTWGSRPKQIGLSVEKVDNGYILRSGREEGEIAKVRICSTIDELRDLFVATIVEYQLEK